MRNLSQSELTHLSGGSMRDADALWVVSGFLGYYGVYMFAKEPTLPKMVAGLATGIFVGMMGTMALCSAGCPRNNSAS